MFKRGLSLILALTLVFSTAPFVPAFPFVASKNFLSARMTGEALAENLVGMQSNPILGEEVNAKVKRLAEVGHTIPEGSTGNEVLNHSIPANVDIIAQRIVPKAGSFTGSAAASHAKEAGATGILAGHSETRSLLGDDSKRINAQLKSGFEQNFRTIIHAVGEPHAERARGGEYARLHVYKQLELEWGGLTAEQVGQLIVAYEPLWSIKSAEYEAKPCSPEDAEEMAAAIREYARRRFGDAAARSMRILYGGSVDKTNVSKYVTLPDIDGVLVGTAATKPDDFQEIGKALVAAGPKEGRIPYFGANWKAIELAGDVKIFTDLTKAASANAIQIGIAPEIIRFTTTLDVLKGAFATVRHELGRVMGENLPADAGANLFGPELPSDRPMPAQAANPVSLIPEPAKTRTTFTPTDGSISSLRTVLEKDTQAYKLRLDDKYLAHSQKNLEWYLDRLLQSTAGVRGVCDLDDIFGGEEINASVVIFVAQMYADYINDNFPQTLKDGTPTGTQAERSAVVGYDERKFSGQFARLFMRVLAGNDIKVNRDMNEVKGKKYATSTATPVSSYAAYHLRAASAIMNTSSHNPKEQHGIKSQGPNGGVDTDDISERISKKSAALMQSIREGKAIIPVAAINDPIIESANFKRIYFDNYWKRVFTPDRMRYLENNIREAERNGRSSEVLLDGLFGVAGPTFRTYLEWMIQEYKLDADLWHARFRIRNDEPDWLMGGILKPDPSREDAIEKAGDLQLMVENPQIVAVGQADNDADRLGGATRIGLNEVQRARKLGLYVSLVKKDASTVALLRPTSQQFFTVLSYAMAIKAVLAAFPDHIKSRDEARKLLDKKYQERPKGWTDQNEADLKALRESFVLITTVPTSMLTGALMDYLGGRLILTGVGFKYIGKQGETVDKRAISDGVKSIIIGIFEESGGAIYGPVDAKNLMDQQGRMSIHRDKDTLVTLMLWYEETFRLAAHGENFLDLYAEMAESLGGLIYYKRLDCFLPDERRAAADKAMAEKVKAAVVAKAERLENNSIDIGNEIVHLLEPMLGKNVTVLSSHNETILLANMYLKDEETSEWGFKNPTGVIHKLSNGWQIQVFHIGSPGMEGPCFRILNADGKEMARLSFRKSGTESLVRFYLDNEEPFDSPNPHNLIYYFTPFIQYLGLDQYRGSWGEPATATKAAVPAEPNYLVAHLTDIEGKYPLQEDPDGAKSLKVNDVIFAEQIAARLGRKVLGYMPIEGAFGAEFSDSNGNSLGWVVFRRGTGRLVYVSGADVSLAARDAAAQSGLDASTYDLGRTSDGKPVQVVSAPRGALVDGIPAQISDALATQVVTAFQEVTFYFGLASKKTVIVGPGESLIQVLQKYLEESLRAVGLDLASVIGVPFGAIAALGHHDTIPPQVRMIQLRSPQSTDTSA